VAQIAKKYNLISTFETLEGHESLSNKDLLSLLEYSSVLAKDQGGCRLLQKKIEDCDEEIKDLIFEETIETFMDIMNDPFGNYLAQKIAENCKED
jgi:pumilio RNA-binding family